METMEDKVCQIKKQMKSKHHLMGKCPPSSVGFYLSSIVSIL